MDPEMIRSTHPKHYTSQQHDQRKTFELIQAVMLYKVVYFHYYVAVVLFHVAAQLTRSLKNAINQKYQGKKRIKNVKKQ